MVDETGSSAESMGITKDQTVVRPNPFKEGVHKAQALAQRINAKLRGPNPYTHGALVEMAQQNNEQNGLEKYLESLGTNNEVGTPGEYVYSLAEGKTRVM